MATPNYGYEKRQKELAKKKKKEEKLKNRAERLNGEANPDEPQLISSDNNDQAAVVND